MNIPQLKKTDDLIQWFVEIDSTNRYLMQKQEVSRQGLCCVAEIQTEGQGRKGRTWSSEKGGLYSSAIFFPGAPPETWPQINYVASVAYAESIEELCMDVKVSIKWPNDLIIRGRKVGGILLQSSIGQRSRVVVGVGINVHNSIDRIPGRLVFPATSLKIESQEDVSVRDLAIRGHRKLLEYYALWCRFPEQVFTRWKNRSAILGNIVVIETSTGKIKGTAKDFTERGMLLVECDGGIMEIVEGDIVRIDHGHPGNNNR